MNNKKSGGEETGTPYKNQNALKKINMENEKRDDMLWGIAKKRASFKWSLAAYVIVNAFLTGIWFLSDGDSAFWPIWPILGWGIAIVFQYFDAYHGNNVFSAEKEYYNLKNKQSQQ
jgi:hypothetical protein